MRSLWHWVSQLVPRSRRGKERLRLSVDQLPGDYRYFAPDGTVHYGHADDVLRLLYRDGRSATGGLGPFRTEGVGLGPLARSVSGTGGTSGSPTTRINIDLARHSNRG